MRVLLLIVDQLHLGYLGAYGCAWVATPSFDHWAAEGVLFDAHHAECPNAAASRRSWRTSGTADLLQALREQGIETVLIRDASRPRDPGFAVDWSEVQDIHGDEEATPLECTLEATRDTLESLAHIDRWLLAVELATLVPPWDVTDEDLEPYFCGPEGENEEEADGNDVLDDDGGVEPQLDPPTGPLPDDNDATFRGIQRTYAAAVTYLDGGLGLLREVLDELDLTNAVTVLLTSDRGPVLGERGVVGDGATSLHEECVHLPLLLRFPDGVEAGRRLPALTRAADLLPTLAALLGLELPKGEGRNLLPLARGLATGGHASVRCELPRPHGTDQALRTPDWALIVPATAAPEEPLSGPRLYVKPDDRWEVNDVAQHHPELVEALLQQLSSG